jgi:hypothetical protein
MTVGSEREAVSSKRSMRRSIANCLLFTVLLLTASVAVAQQATKSTG